MDYPEWIVDKRKWNDQAIQIPARVIADEEWEEYWSEASAEEDEATEKKRKKKSKMTIKTKDVLMRRIEVNWKIHDQVQN